MTRRLATSSLALLAMAVPALAEITPAEVWDQLIKENTAMGVTVTEGGREEAGANLTITDAVFANEAEGSSMTITMPKVVLNETGDGGVRWMVEGDITGQVTSAGADGEPITIPFTAALPGNETVTTGSIDDLTHDYKSDSVNVTVNIPVDAEGAAPIPLTITMEGLTGTQKSVGAEGENRDVSFTSNVAKMVVAATGEAPKSDTSGGGKFSGQGELNAVEFAGKVVMPAGEFNYETQMEEALKAGAEFAVDMKYADSTGSFEFDGTDVDGAPQQGSGSMKSGASALTFSLSDDGLAYAGSAEASESQMTSSQMPFPITYAMSAAKFDLAMPIMQSETAAPFRLLTSITGLTVNDEVWALFDPETKLPRDPADLNIDVTGEMIMPESLFTPPVPGEAPAADAPADAPADDTAEAPAMPEGPQPPMPVKVSINDVTLKAVGAEAHLKGELNAPEGGDMTTPIGQIDGQFTGVNALLDSLGALGLIPEDQMMGARMMLAMFAKPVEGDPNKLETKLEFREGGSIFANGQQVK